MSEVSLLGRLAHRWVVGVRGRARHAGEGSASDELDEADLNQTATDVR
jgi:hypothetical protein